jgi:O-antigen ligase
MATMRLSDRVRERPSFGLQPLLFGTIMAVLWVAGGASRPDVMAQAIVRSAAWLCLILAIVLGSSRPFVRGRVPAMFLGLAILLVLVQLVPLPPAFWLNLPGRAAFAGADMTAPIAGWRPLAIVPSAAINALASLIVPVTVLYIATSGKGVDDRSILSALLLMVVSGMLVGLLQFAGLSLGVSFVNGGGEASGTFANRNHFALMTAFGFLLLPAWVFRGDQVPGWRGPVALGLVPLLALAILASGSRAGTLVGGFAVIGGLALAFRPLRRVLRGYPRWVSLGLVAAFVILLAAVVGLSIAADRAISLNRAMTIDPGQDMRARALGTVLDMVRLYLPIGSGFGGFDPLFRAQEPMSLLKPTYFNRAHNDFLEIALEAGLPGVALVAAGVLWWVWASLGAWRREQQDRMLARVGSAMLLLVMIASTVDYPARTPMIMSAVVLAALWLSGARSERGVALPRNNQNL